MFSYIDIDECSLAPMQENVCPQLTTVCVNLNGSYRCDCLPGYVKDSGSVIYVNYICINIYTFCFKEY
jgi:hypothetical protein